MTMQKFSNERAMLLLNHMKQPDHITLDLKQNVKQQMETIVDELNKSKYSVAFDKIKKIDYGYKIVFKPETSYLIKYIIHHAHDIDFDIHSVNFLHKGVDFSFFATDETFTDIINCAVDVFHFYLKFTTYRIAFVDCMDLPDDDNITFVRIVKGPFDINCLQYKPLHIFQPHERIMVGEGNEKVTWSDNGVMEIYERFHMINTFLFIFIIIDKNLPLLDEFFSTI